MFTYEIFKSLNLRGEAATTLAGMTLLTGQVISFFFLKKGDVDHFSLPECVGVLFFSKPK